MELVVYLRGDGYTSLKGRKCSLAILFDILWLIAHTMCRITIVVGLTAAVLLPDFPDTWKALSPELKHIANRRMAIDAAEADVDVGGSQSIWKGAKLAFSDPKVS